MQITKIRIRRTFSEGPMKAVVSVTFDDVFAVHDIKVIHAGEKEFITMPGRMLKDGTYRDAAHPIDSDFRAVLESAVLEAYNAHILESAVLEAYNAHILESKEKKGENV